MDCIFCRVVTVEINISADLCTHVCTFRKAYRIRQTAMQKIHIKNVKNKGRTDLTQRKLHLILRYPTISDTFTHT